MKQQSGFTLIELIAVIVILGIIAAVAVPRFVDLTGAAEEASVKGVAGSLASASSLNYAAYVARDAGIASGPDPVAISDCQNVEGLLEGGSLPDNYFITSATVTAGNSVECTVGFENDSGAVDSEKPSATFTAYGATAPTTTAE